MVRHVKTKSTATAVGVGVDSPEISVKQVDEYLALKADHGGRVGSASAYCVGGLIPVSYIIIIIIYFLL